MNKKVKSILTKAAYPFAKKFIAGTEPEDAIKTAKELNKMGLEAIINFLGEDVKNPEEAMITRNFYLFLMGAIHGEKIKARISVKPSQLGLQINPAVYFNNLLIIGKVAIALKIPVEIDMEHFKDIEATINTTISVKTLLPELNLRQAIQVRLKRSTRDIIALRAAGVKIRLCKGAYKDDESAVFSDAKTKERYYKYAKILTQSKANTAIATHDSKILKRFLKEFPNDINYEIQLLYGFKKRLAKKLGKKHQTCPSYSAAIYIPFGSNWLPYGLRRFKYLAKKLPSIIWDEIISLFN